MRKAKEHWKPIEDRPTPEGIVKVRYFLYMGELPVRVNYYPGDIPASAEIPKFENNAWRWVVDNDYKNVPSQKNTRAELKTKRSFDAAVKKYLDKISAEPLGSSPAP